MTHEIPAQDISTATLMRERVMALPFPGYCQLVRRLLYHSGYSSIQTVGTGAKRKTIGKGGLDLLAFSHTDLTTTLTAIQIKRHKASVPRRFIDELRGTMVRLGVEQGLLIVTSRFSVVAKRAAEESPSLPVQLVDGEELISRLIARRIGLKQARGDGNKHVWKFDSEYFDLLEKRAMEALRDDKVRGLADWPEDGLPPKRRWP